MGPKTGLRSGRAQALLDQLQLKFKSVLDMRRKQVLAAGLEEPAIWNGIVLTSQLIDEVLHANHSCGFEFNQWHRLDWI